MTLRGQAAWGFFDAGRGAGNGSFVFHDRVFAGIINSPKTLINLRQVGDTLVLTGYMAEHEKDRDNKMYDTFVQTRVVVLKARKPEPSDKLGKAMWGREWAK